MNLQPMNKMLVVEPDKQVTTIGGIELPQQARRSPNSGIIIARANDAPTELEIGKRIYYSGGVSGGAFGMEFEGELRVVVLSDAVIGYELVAGDKPSALMTKEEVAEVRSPVQAKPN